MDNHDFYKLNRKALMEHFKRERLEWLDAGMNEADIFRIHFGEDGRGGDYAVWLSERKHTRADHKYCPGAPLSIEEADPDGVWIPDANDAISEFELQADFEHALNTLTEIQRYCIIEVCLNERTYRDVASERGKHPSTVKEAVKSAKAKLKKYF
jgi:hypothetical protein